MNIARMKILKSCKEISIIYLEELFFTGVYVRESSRDLIVEFGDKCIFQRKINYCPMCGRKLTEE